MPIITRSFEFDAGHRVLGHEGKCRHLHGHRYRAEVTVQAPELDSLGRVVDFSVLKEKVGGWIDANWDHNVLLHRDDPLLHGYVSSAPIYDLWLGKYPYSCYYNPTAENMAYDLYEKAVAVMPPHIKVVQVRLYETPNCWADYPDETRR